MPTLKTPHATVTHDPGFTVIGINLNNPKEPLDILDIQEIYCAFYRKWLHERVKTLSPHDLIQVASQISRETYPWMPPTYPCSARSGPPDPPLSANKDQIIRDLCAWLDSEFDLDTWPPNSPGRKLLERAQNALTSSTQ